MGTQLYDIGDRIAGLRESCGMTREEMAAELHIDEKVYADYEENGVDIPISIIFEIANKFGVDFTEIITGTAAKLNTYHVVRAGQGRSVDRFDGYRYKDLAFRYNQKVMQPLLVTLKPNDKPATMLMHKGQEFNYVLEGIVILTFDNKEFVLNKGDSIYFNSTHAHSQRCGSTTNAVFLTMIAE